MAGINRALPIAGNESYKFHNIYSSMKEDKPCIFLSHISVDKQAVKGIADYIMEKADIDVYLDIHDDELQRAVDRGDSAGITELIERGIASSTHTMCLISKKTIESWWVPYEIGYAKKSGKEISSLKLKETVELPDFLKIGEIIHGTKSLNEYIQKVISDFKNNTIYSNINESLEHHRDDNHPLDNILDWNK
ncbi:toll/interleukin-1 receptor domain-containing protein [Moritella viscosa]|nr:toll/interleukin-1 receptor domain-containing protein [Moritella viscosa]